ncbi:MAG TPA: tetratricopeptide repeat protein, partial [Candidatus Sulfotelmatobacter sp.]|nr:tetratricopeptide repeat protein [Candidatus Sulfotelmatobacter sp.]
MLLAACLAVGLAGAAEPLPGEGDLRVAVREFEAGNLASATEALLRLEGATVAPSVSEGRDLLLGMLLARQGRGDEAIPRLASAAAQPLLGDYALSQLAGVYRAAGRRPEAAEALEQLWDRHPRSLLRERAGREAARDWLEAGDLPKAEAAAGRYLTAYRLGSGSGEVWLTLGEALAQSGRTERAEQVFRRLWLEMPGSPEAQRAQERLEAVGAPPFSDEERFQRALNLHRLGRYALAQAELGPFATAGGPHEVRARLNLGIGAFQLRKYDLAVRWLSPLASGAGPERVESLYWLGRSAGRAGDTSQFEEVLGRLADTGPSARAEEALYILAK